MATTIVLASASASASGAAAQQKALPIADLFGGTETQVRERMEEPRFDVTVRRPWSIRFRTNFNAYGVIVNGGSQSWLDNPSYVTQATYSIGAMIDAARGLAMADATQEGLQRKKEIDGGARYPPSSNIIEVYLNRVTFDETRETARLGPVEQFATTRAFVRQGSFEK